VSGPGRDRPLDESELHSDPIRQFQRWFDEAKTAGEPEPEAMALATSTLNGEPSNRFVLLKGVDARGFVFYTNGRSRKGRELAANPRAALAFRWWTVERQVRVSGPIAPLAPGESDAYFKTRPLGAQLGAWASAQSEQVASRAVLDRQLMTVTERFVGRDVPRPPWWGGFRVRPTEVEFWQGRRDRLHDRLCYRLVGGRWRIQRLNP
jgi:pyridoxamine 5'-phosphate oxidase